jgi:hypothetical protein
VGPQYTDVAIPSPACQFDLATSANTTGSPTLTDENPPLPDHQQNAMPTNAEKDDPFHGFQQSQISEESSHSVSRKEATFLGLPVELRNEVYRRLLVVGQGPEFTPFDTPDGRIDVRILGVCKKIREEARRVLVRENRWIYVSPPEPVDYDCEKLDINMVVDPPAQIKLGNEDMGEFTRRVETFLCIGSHPKGPMFESSPLEGCFFAFNSRSFANMCDTISYYAAAYDNILVFGHAPQLLSENPRMYHNILFPLALIRELGNVIFFPPEDPEVREIVRSMKTTMDDFDMMTKHILVWKHEAERELRQNRLAEAAHYFECGGNAAARWSGRVQELYLLVGAQSSTSANDFWSVEADLHNCCCSCINKLVDLRRYGQSLRIAKSSLPQIIMCLLVADMAFPWPGMSDSQRRTAHLNRSTAYRNRAEWETYHGDSNESRIRAWFEEAAKDLFYADQLTPRAERNEALITDVNQRLGRIATTELHAPLRTFHDPASNLVWVGDVRLVEQWERAGPVQDLPSRRLRTALSQ